VAISPSSVSAEKREWNGVPKLTLRIDFDDGHALGPGKVRLLEEVAAKGSIRKAATAMKMSYRRAWLLLKAVEKTFGGPVILTETGGKRGGGAALTGLGKKIVRHYRRCEEAARGTAKGEITALVRLRKS
jgi:molybdate transport system regulatory protein